MLARVRHSWVVSNASTSRGVAMNSSLSWLTFLKLRIIVLMYIYSRLKELLSSWIKSEVIHISSNHILGLRLNATSVSSNIDATCLWICSTHRQVNNLVFTTSSRNCEPLIIFAILSSLLFTIEWYCSLSRNNLRYDLLVAIAFRKALRMITIAVSYLSLYIQL